MSVTWRTKPWVTGGAEMDGRIEFDFELGGFRGLDEGETESALVGFLMQVVDVMRGHGTAEALEYT